MTTPVTRMNVVARRIMLANAEGSVQAATSAGSAEDIGPADVKRVVPLFAGTSVPVDAPSAPMSNEDNWIASIDLVRSTAARVRALHERAQTVAQDAKQLVSTATASARAAEERTRRAETATRAALARVEQAEEQARHLLDKLLTAEARAGAAEAKAGEALVWLRRMHECVAGEFSSLTIGPVPLSARSVASAVPS